jgi:hypothetical protein
MKLLKVILISILLSFIISIITSIVGYTPLAKRDHDVYYLSFEENLVFGLFYITPILLIFSVIAYSMYILLGKFERFFNLKSFKKIFLSVLIAGILIFITIYLNVNNSKTNDIYLIPEGYEGDVLAFYNIKGAPKVETENGYDVHTINEKGYYVTSTPDLDYGTVRDIFYYVDEKGNRTPISEKCTNLFGTGGYMTSEGDEEIDIRYTGYKLTKDHCSSEFITERHGKDQENYELIIHDILKQYYGIERNW